MQHWCQQFDNIDLCHVTIIGNVHFLSQASVEWNVFTLRQQLELCHRLWFTIRETSKQFEFSARAVRICSFKNHFYLPWFSFNFLPSLPVRLVMRSLRVVGLRGKQGNDMLWFCLSACRCHNVVAFCNACLDAIKHDAVTCLSSAVNSWAKF